MLVSPIIAMRIVAVADTHLFHADLNPVPEGDVFVHAGDLLRAGTLEELATVAKWIDDLPHRHKIVVPGNHDWCFQLEPQKSRDVLGAEVVCLCDSSISIDGLLFYGSPWQPEFNSWAFNLPRGEALKAKWKDIPVETDILITHGPPSGIGDRSPVHGRAGCEDLLEAVRRVAPALHLYGHIHQDGGVWERSPTCFANVTTWECERGPTIVDIELNSRTVTVVDAPPRRR